MLLFFSLKGESLFEIYPLSERYGDNFYIDISLF